MSSARKILFWVHLAAGCVAGAVILIMSITGVLLAYQRQIVGWSDRAYHSTPQVSGSRRLSIDDLLARFSMQDPHAAPSAITLRADPSAPVEFALGREQVFLVDAYSGKVLGPSAPRARAFLRTSENLHRWLAASVEHRAAGRAVTGAGNLAFLILVISGPFIWLPRKWSMQNVRAVTLFRAGLSGRARDFNWHNVVGIWCVLPLMVIVVSGVVMSYPWANALVFKLTGSPVPAQNRGNRSERGDRPASHPTLLEPLFTKARTTAPGWRSIALRMPPSGRSPLIFNIDTDDNGRPDKRSQLTVDPQTGKVIRWEPFSSYNRGASS